MRDRKLTPAEKAEILLTGVATFLIPLTEQEQQRLMNIATFMPAEHSGERLVYIQTIEGMIEMLQTLLGEVQSRVQDDCLEIVRIESSEA